MRILKRVFLNFALIILGLFAILVFLEVYLRIFSSNIALSPGTYISHPRRRYALKPYFKGKTYDQAYKINSCGFRDYEYPQLRMPDTIRILAVGDSCTFGTGLRLEDTYPKQLEKALNDFLKNKSMRAEVINTGVPSYNTVYEYYFIEEVGVKYSPDIIIIGYVYNDSILNYPLTSSKYKFLNNIKDFLRQLYSYEFIVDKIYDLSYAVKGLASNDPAVRRENIEYLYSDGYAGWQKNKEAFIKIRELAARKGIKVIYLIYPKIEKLDDYPYGFYHQKVKEALSKEQYVLDLFPYFQDKIDRELWVNNFDSHPNRKANTLISDAIFNYLVENKLL